MTPPANSHELATAIPGAELVTIPGAGHLSNLDQPPAFEAALRPFLTRHAARATSLKPAPIPAG